MHLARLPRLLTTVCALFSTLSFSTATPAALLDEVQVYADDINAPGEFGTELHLNTTPKGIQTQSYPGEAVNHRGIRMTPELSWGISKTFEVGLYLPVTRSGEGTWYGAGVKLRAKWLPVQPETHGGWFAGVNTELGQLKRQFSESSRAVEVRTIVGWKDDEWLFAANPTLGWDLSRGYTHNVPEFKLGVKASKRLLEQFRFGLEYYSGMGRLNNRLPSSQQDNTLYVAWDYEGKPFAFNLGLGRGLNSATDAWTVKAIVDLPF